MNTWPSIRREAAMALSPLDLAKGNKELDAIIESAARCIAKREILFGALQAIGGAVIFIGCLLYMIFTYRVPPETFAGNVTLGVVLLALAIVVLTWWGWTAIQHGKTGQRFGKLTGVTIPKELQKLIDSFASGVRDARTASGTTVLPYLFESCWAIMLFSHDHRQRRLVRSPRGARQKEEIFALPTQPEPVPPVKVVAAQHTDVEPPLRNFDPAMAWLVDGPLEQFMQGLNSLLDTLPPHQVDAYRLILTVARRELRKGGQTGAQEEVIRIILVELDNEGLRIRGTSRSKIMQLIHGKHGKKDICGYFIRHAGGHPPSNQTDQDSFG